MTKAKLVVVVGPMAAGKSDELIRLVSRKVIAKRQVIAFSPEADTRTQPGYIMSRDGRKIEAIKIGNPYQMVDLVRDAGRPDLIAIDEAHLYERDYEISLVPTVDTLLQYTDEIIVSACDMDFLGRPFDTIAKLMAMANRVLKLSAVCMCCHQDASMSQRLDNGRPVPRNTPRFVVGHIRSSGDDSVTTVYEPRCRNCHEIVD